MIYIYTDTATIEDLEIVFSNTALFDQYDEAPELVAANDEEYDNLYPFIG